MNSSEQSSKPKLPRRLIIALVVFVGLAALTGSRAKDGQSCPFYAKDSSNKRQCVVLDKAITSAERQQGLSGVNGILPAQGMLFVFDEPEAACMWMKDMKFSLDIIWLDADKTITKIEENVSPDTYPKFFCANQPAKYVIEVNAGVAKQADLKLDQQLKL